MLSAAMGCPRSCFARLSITALAGRGGRWHLVADMHANAVYVIDGERLTSLSLLPARRGAHRLCVSP
jgi:hypothetical protein